ncbi:MAG: hypothetical protein MUF52_11880 [Syntrophobacteraceae bacterium]|jgi:hypothetical protein|nr:hypothetical protein [Syntrophobacteraceae bacterium]
MSETRLRWHAVITGLVLVVLVSALTPYNNIKIHNSPLSGGHFPLIALICLLFLLVIVNPVLSLFNRAWRFQKQELFLIWSMVTVASGIAFTGLMRTFIINLTTAQWFGTASGEVGRVLVPLLPRGLFPESPDTVRTLYNGLEGGLDMSWWEILARVDWVGWTVPLMGWSCFIGLVYLVIIGMVGLFSHQWIENEKMSFPLLRVTEILAEESDRGTLARFLSRNFFLLGVSIPLLLHLFNGLHTYYPQVPQIPTLILAQPYIPKDGLLSGFYKAKIYIYPAFIGFAFLASKQISFSLWAFFIAGGLFPGLMQSLGWRLPAAALGTTFGPGLSRVEEMQMVGAFFIFFLFIVWLARQHLAWVARSVFRGDEGAEEMHGLIRPRPALVCMGAGWVGLMLWSGWAGLSLLPTMVFLGVCFFIQLVATRLICQGGLPYFTLALAPMDGLLAFVDTRLIAPLTLFMSAVMQKMTFVDLRESLMPSVFHASRLSTGSEPRFRFFGAIVSAIALSLVVSFVAMVALSYKFGIATLPDDWAVETTRRVHENVSQLISHPEEPKEWSMIFTGVGAAIMLVLVMGYHQFIWWPLHPIGYLTAYSTAMQVLWFGFFIGWLCNVVVLRYGGVSLYREVRALFIGLVVGDLVMAAVWLVVGLFASISYHALPL